MMVSILPAGSHWPGVRVGGVVDVANAEKIGRGHHPQLLVAHFKHDPFERIGKLWKGQTMSGLGIKPFQNASTEGQNRNGAARVADNFQTDIEKKFDDLPLLIGGQSPAAGRGLESVVAAKENQASHRWSRLNNSDTAPVRKLVVSVRLILIRIFKKSCLDFRACRR